LTVSATVVALGAIALRILGVPSVDIHGPLHYLGIMDPLCGGTRATFLLLASDPVGAARYNPVVFPVAAAVLAVLACAGIVIGHAGWTSRPTGGNAHCLCCSLSWSLHSRSASSSTPVC
jgi:hypothetical protein